jgi:hypothetical protein
MLSVTYMPFMHSIIMLNVVMLSVIVLNVVMLSVVAPSTLIVLLIGDKEKKRFLKH